MKNKNTTYIVVRTETRVKNFANEESAKSWIDKQKDKDGDSKGRVEYSIWQSPVPAAE